LPQRKSRERGQSEPDVAQKRGVEQSAVNGGGTSGLAAGGGGEIEVRGAVEVTVGNEEVRTKRDRARTGAEGLVDVNCKRSDGSNRAFFATVEEAREFQQRPEYVADYGEDEVRFCTRCGNFHLSHPTWVKPWEIATSEMKVN
jgi:hypothetical protein